MSTPKRFEKRNRRCHSQYGRTTALVYTRVEIGFQKKNWSETNTPTGMYHETLGVHKRQIPVLFTVLRTGGGGIFYRDNFNLQTHTR